MLLCKVFFAGTKVGIFDKFRKNIKVFYTFSRAHGRGVSRGGLLAHEALCNPGVDAEEYDEHGLQGMDDKNEIKGLLVGDTIEDEHRLDGEMPGACSVGRRHDDGDGAHDEGD